MVEEPRESTLQTFNLSESVENPLLSAREEEESEIEQTFNVEQIKASGLTVEIKSLPNSPSENNHNTIQLNSSIITTAPTTEEDLSDKDSESSEVYCFCRKGDDGHFMIQCDDCEEW